MLHTRAFSNSRRVNFHPYGSGCRKRAASPYSAEELPHPLRIIFPFLARNRPYFKWNIPLPLLGLSCRAFKSLGWYLQPNQLLQLLQPGKHTGRFVGDTLHAFQLIQGWKGRYHKSCQGHRRLYPNELLLYSSDCNRLCAGFDSVHDDLKSSDLYQSWHPFDAGSSDISSMMSAVSTSPSLRAELEAEGYYKDKEAFYRRMDL